MTWQLIETTRGEWWGKEVLTWCAAHGRVLAHFRTGEGWQPTRGRMPMDWRPTHWCLIPEPPDRSAAA